jgi:ATP-dependent DNA helicase DinG
MDRCALLVQDLNCFTMQERPDCVYWVEVTDHRKMGVRLISAPIDVGPDVKRCLFDKYRSVILTSATLSSGPAPIARAAALQTGSKGASLGEGRLARDFEFFTGRIGLDDFDAVKLGSPFDYFKQVTLYIEKGLPDPNEPAFLETAAEVVKKYVLKTAGRAFVLFTSYAMLEEIAGRLSGWLAENNIALHQQGAGIDRTTLLERFKAGSRSCLFGTDSFWQGVDVPGADLANVIIVRLPFAVPDKPLLAGRLQQITEKGGNPFYDYQLPSAIIKFKQGFGRLIRSKTDRGIVVILDSRVVNKSYGTRFLAAIPTCRIKIVAAKR